MENGQIQVQPAAGPPLCELRGITKRFGGVAALRDVDFSVRSGEVHALVGENGAGKSTLMKVLHGLYSPDSGEIRVNGQRVTLGSPRDAERLGIAMIPQELELFPDLSVVENLFVGRPKPRRRRLWIDDRAMRRLADEVFSELGVRIDARAPTRHLSVAARQLVAIARALLGAAGVVIMDEPTAALTERESERLFGVVDELRSRGVGIIYISHRLAEVTSIADRITVMRDGRQVSTNLATEITPGEIVKQMVGRPLAQLFSREHTAGTDIALEVRGLGAPGEFADISFRVHRGEVLGVAGLIGAGRTELAHAIFGINPAVQGEICVGGRPARIRNVQDAFRHGIGYVPEERRAQALFLPITIRRNIAFAALRMFSKRGMVQRGREAEAAGALFEQLAVRGGKPTDPVAQLSGGNQQKVVLAKSMCLQPSVLILDEPTRGVDIGARAEIYRLIDQMAREGIAIILISSELDEVLSMSDRILVMREGRISAEFEHDAATRETVTAAAAGLGQDAVRTGSLRPEQIEAGVK
ncbi:MAG: sugar ABC transporter ATP-binding protein [Solirubrobacteraceae bacterium]